MRQAGADPVTMLITDAGYDNYSTTIATSRKLIGEKKEFVQRFVTASPEGCVRYLKGGPAIEAANAPIEKDSPEMTDEKIACAIEVMNEEDIVLPGDAPTFGIGARADARRARLRSSMADAGVLPERLDPGKGSSPEFVDQGVGRA